MESSASSDVLHNIKKYAEQVKQQKGDVMDIEGQESHAIEARLNSTITELQARLEQRQAELDRVSLFEICEILTVH